MNRLRHPRACTQDQTISAPHMHGSCLEVLSDHLTPGARALDVGGSHAQEAACLGKDQVSNMQRRRAPPSHPFIAALLPCYVSGSGSGYLTACMALMVGPSGYVLGIEKVWGHNLPEGEHGWLHRVR